MFNKLFIKQFDQTVVNKLIFENVPYIFYASTFKNKTTLLLLFKTVGCCKK